MTPETTAKIFTVAALNYRQQFTDDEVAATQSLWYNTFRQQPDDLMETAMRLVLLNSLFFPNIADIQKAITELLQEARYDADKPRQLPAGQTRMALDKVQELLRQFRAGTYKISVDHLMGFARNLFPDISEATVDRNYNEFAAAKARAEYCAGCIWTPGECYYGGYQVRLDLESSGWVHETTRPCHKRVMFNKAA